MLRRYVLPCVVIYVVAAIVGVAVTRSAGSTFSASCSIEISEPVTQQKLGSDFFAFNQKLAQTLVFGALDPNVYQKAAPTGNVTVDELAQNTTVSAGTSTLPATIAVTNPDAHRAAILANAMCNYLVDEIKNQQSALRAAQSSVVADRIGELVAQRNQVASLAPDQRTPSQQAVLDADDAAIKNLKLELASTLSAPPNLVTVLSLSSAGALVESHNYTRNLLIAGVAATLAVFLVILAGEILVERRGAAG